MVNGFEFYQRKEIKDLIAYLHLLSNPDDSVAFERVINTPPRKIGKVTVSRIRNFAMENRIGLLDAARHCNQIETIKNAAGKRIKQFVELYDELLKVCHGDVESIIRAVVQAIDYQDWLTADGSDEGFERARNVDELIVATQEFDSEHPEDGGLEAYLEQAALISDTDALDSQAEFVTLMTLHASKGLEFPVVYFVGIEEGILPHERSINENQEVEEERRLMFVGITRAKEELNLSRSHSRFRRGSHVPAIASRFLMELPREEMDVFEPRGYQSSPWDDGFQDEFYEEDFEKEYRSDIDEDGEDDELSFDVDALEAETESFGNEPPTDAAETLERVQGLELELGPELEAKVSGAQLIGSGLPLMTGAQLAEKQAQEFEQRKQDAGKFRAGQIVEHPEYGVGMIVKIAGRGPKAMATIDFTQTGTKTFRLAFTKLELKGP